MKDMENMDKIIVIPDVHGRSFWRDAVKGHEDWRIIFLGDYFDPYGFEGLSNGDAYRELLAILDFKKKHPDNVTLLLGNHDMGYLDRKICRVRMDYRHEMSNRQLLLDNLDLFDIVTVEKGAEKSFLFSHAGVRKAWVSANQGLLGEAASRPELLNDMLHDSQRREALLEALSDVSYLRGGYDYAGSPIWCDVMEFARYGDFLPGYVQMFGHTLHEGGPYLIRGAQGTGYCLDCREAFVLEEDGSLNYCDWIR